MNLKIFKTLLFLVLVVTIYVKAEVDPDLNCLLDQGKYYDLAGTACSTSCSVGEIAIKIGDNKRQCSTCNKLIQEVTDDVDKQIAQQCVDSCNLNYIPQEGTQVCVLSSSCPLKSDSQCFNPCEGNNYALIEINKKTCKARDICQFVREDNKQCLTECTDRKNPDDEKKCEKCDKYYKLGTDEYCSKCPSSDPYATKVDSNFECSKSCTNSLIPNTQTNECISVADCQSPMFLFNNSQECRESCPETNYQYKEVDTVKRCELTCDIKDGANPQMCIPNCSENQKYLVSPDKLYCNKCPKEFQFSNKARECFDKCDGSLFTNNDTHQCLPKEECSFVTLDTFLCLSKCEDKLNPEDEKICKQCDIYYQSGENKYCDKCPSNKYSTKIDGTNNFTCSSECTKPLIPNTQTNNCITIGECLSPNYLLDGKKCQQSCDVFKFKEVNNVLKCETNCPLKDNQDTNLCHEACTDGKQYTYQSSVYCGGCPSGLYQQLTTENHYECKQSCEGEFYLLEGSPNECVHQDKCTFIQTETRKCLTVCSEYQMPNEITKYKTCKSSCGIPNYYYSVVENGQTTNYCEKCPTQYIYKQNETDYSICKKTCDVDQLKQETDHLCLKSKADCYFKYILDKKECIDTCSKFTLDSEKNSKDTKTCQTSCDYIDGTNPTNCLDSCTDGKSYKVGDQIFCIRCPDSKRFSVSTDDAKVFDCQDKCIGEQYTDQQNYKCLKTKEECPDYADIQSKACFSDVSLCKSQRYMNKNKFCSDECTEKFQLVRTDNNKPIYCNQECLFFDGKDNAKKTCYEKCSDEKIYKDPNDVQFCNSCPIDYLVKTQESPNLFKCQNCDGLQVYDKEDEKCLTEASECKKFLVNQKTCTLLCPPSYFTYPDNSNVTYKLCTDKCEFISGNDPISKVCNLTCKDNIIYSVGEGDATQKYCTQCPEANKFKLKVDDTHFTCHATCPQGYIPNTETNECITKENCSTYLVDDKECAKSCGDKYFYEKEAQQSYQVCKSDCAKRSGVLNDKKCFLKCTDDIEYNSQGQVYCSQCPDSVPYKTQVIVQVKQFNCSLKCESSLLAVQETKTCITKEECGKDKYMVDETICSANCSKYIYPSDNSVPKLCTQTCQYLNGDEPDSKNCNKQCDKIVYSVKIGDTIQKYCKQCPKAQPYKQKTDVQDNFQCVSECGEGLVLKKDTSECIQKKECVGFVIENKECSITCPPEYYKYSKVGESSYALCSQSCKFLSSGQKDSKDCVETCTTSVFTTKNNNKEDIKYCDVCPSDLPFKVKTSVNTHNCISQCSENQITDKQNHICYDKKSDCKGYIVDGVECTKECDSAKFKYPNFKEYQRCDTKCQDGFLIDAESKYCYSQKTECPNYVSNNGKQCVKKCDDETEYPQEIEKLKQCRACRQIIKKSTEQNGQNQCVTSCGSDQMVYIFNDSNKVSFQKCVEKKFCETKKISASDKNKCSDACIIPEINLEGKCILECPTNKKYILNSNSCSDGCESDFTSSDSTLCVVNCEKLFEVATEGVQKKCQKCGSDQFFKLINNKGTCKTIVKTAEGQTEIKDNLISSLSNGEIKSPQEVEKAKDAVKVFSKSIEESLLAIASKSEKTDEDQVKAQTVFSDILLVAQTLMKNIDPAVSKKPITLGDTQLKVVSQVAQPGLKFKLTFNANQISSGSVSDLLEANQDEANTAFDPQILQVSYVKNNHYCKGEACKNTRPLFVVKYELKGNKRLLTQQEQTFTMDHEVPAGEDPKKQLCVNYDSDGKPTTQTQGTLNGSKITCTFTSSSSLMYDSTCQIVDKSLCDNSIVIDPTSTSNSDDEDLNGGEIAGIVIGVIAAVGIICVIVLYYLRQQKLAKGKLLKYKDDQVNTENNHLTTNNNNLNTIGDAENLKPNKPILKLQ